MQNTAKDYWKLGKDKFGDTLWMEKPRLCPNGYWEVALVHHYGKGTSPGKGSSRLCAVMATEALGSSSAFEGLLPDDIRLQFAELIRAIIISARYAWMLKRGNTGMAAVPGEDRVIQCSFFKGIARTPPYWLETERIDKQIIPGLVKLVDNLFKKKRSNRVTKVPE